MPRQPNIINHLETEWERLNRSGEVDEALLRWRGREPSLVFASVHDIVAALADQSAPGDTHDDILRPLLRLAPTEPLAGRLLLIRFLPYLKMMIGWDHPFDDDDEWLALLVASAYEVIHSYPLSRRPHRIAGNIAWDVRKRVYAALKARRRADAELTPTGRLPVSGRDVPAEDMLARVEDADELLRATRRASVTPDVLELCVLTRAAGMTIQSLAAELLEQAPTLRQRRWRAERRIEAVLSPN